MTKKQQAHALQIAMHLRSRAQIASTPGNLDTLSASAANELERQHARIAELEQGKCLHQIAEPAAPVVKPIKDAIDALVMAAFTEGGCSEHRMSEARIQTELRKKELRTLLSTPQPCSRSHPHEEMTPMCELRTEIARLTNALARAEAQLAAAPQAVQAVAWLAEYVDREGNSKWYVSTHKDLATENDMNAEPKPLYTHPTQQGLEPMGWAAEINGAHFRQFGDWLPDDDCYDHGTLVKLYALPVSEKEAESERTAIAAQAKQGGV